MTKNEMETAPRQQSQSPVSVQTPIGTTPILPKLPADVKAIRDLRTERHIPVGDIVEVVASVYPRFDRYLLSKVEHGEEYGIRLRADAWHTLMTHFKLAQDGSKARRTPNRTKPKRISCRLTEKAYGLLQRELDRTGMTMQGFIEALITQAISGGKTNG